MVTTDKGQQISIEKDGIKILSSTDTQLIKFDDIKSVNITDDNVLQIICNDFTMQYQLINTENCQEFVNEFGINKLKYKHENTGKENSNSDSVQNGKGNISININNSATNQMPTGIPAYLVGKKRVKKLTYILLALFLGGIGAHKFYSGKTLMGVIYLVFCWTYIPAIIALIEMIVAITKKSDAEGYIYI